MADWLSENLKSPTFRLWYYWVLIREWWLTDVWGWIVDVPCSPEGKFHCVGRRTKRPVYCPDCDGGNHG